MPIGSDRTRLIVLRGNSGSGRSTVAAAPREAYGRGMAWVSQDLIRRTILREKDRPDGVNIGLIGHVVRYSLDLAILDGILYADRYEKVLAGLPGRGRSHRIDHPAHDPCVLANLPAAGEAELLEEFDGRAEQETAWRLAAGGHLGDGLDEATAGMGELVESAFQRRPCDALAAMLLVDVEAGDPPVRTRRRVRPHSGW